MTTRFYDLTFHRHEDGCIHLAQSDYGEDSTIYAHPEQILFIARQLCGLTPDHASTVAELRRRISVLADRLNDLITADWLRSQVVDCPDGVEIVCRFDGLLDLAIEFDGGRLLPGSYEDARNAPVANENRPTDTGVSPGEIAAPETPQMSLAV